MIKGLILSLGLSLMTVLLYAQSTTPVCGGSVKNSASGSMSYTIGQVDYLFSKSVSGSAVAGVQQTFDESMITETNCDGIGLTLYPNPTSDDVYVSCEDYKADYHYILTDMTGKLFSEGTLSGELTKISMRQLNDGAYLLKIVCGDGKDEFTSFKIIVKK